MNLAFHRVLSAFSFIIFMNANCPAADVVPEASTSTTASLKELTDYALSYREAAEAGNAQAQYNLGAAYRWGVGVAQDLTQAVHWIQLSAEKGYAPAQRTLASMYEKGDGLSQSDGEALKWYKRAAAQGDSMAEQSLEALRSKLYPVDRKPQ